MSKTDEASSCYGKVAWTVILRRPQISGILIVDNLTTEVAPKNRVTYGENIQDNVDKSINVVEQENDGKTLESSSSATVPHLPFTVLWTMECQLHHGSLKILTSLTWFNHTRQHVNTIDRPFPLEASLKELLAVVDILFLVPMDHSPAMMKVFEQRTLNDVCNQVLGELVPENIAKISDSDFIKVTDVINAADSKVINVREGKRGLLKLAANNEQYGWQCHWRISKCCSHLLYILGLNKKNPFK